MTEKKYTLSVANTTSPQDHLADHADLCGRGLPPQLTMGQDTMEQAWWLTEALADEGAVKTLA